MAGSCVEEDWPVEEGDGLAGRNVQEGGLWKLQEWPIRGESAVADGSICAGSDRWNNFAGRLGVAAAAAGGVTAAAGVDLVKGN